MINTGARRSRQGFLGFPSARKVSLRRCTGLAVALALVLPTVSMGADPAPGASGTLPTVAGKGIVRVRIYQGDKKHPVAAEAIRAVHVDSGKTFSAGPCAARRGCEIRGVPYGYLDLAVETPQGPFPGDRLITLAPGGTLKLDLILKAPREVSSDQPGEPQKWNTGSVAAPETAVARVTEQLSGKAFWKSPAGIAIIVGSSAAVLWAISASGKGSASPYSTTR